MGQYLADGQFYDFHDSAPIQFSEIHAEIEGASATSNTISVPGVFFQSKRKWRARLFSRPANFAGGGQQAKKQTVCRTRTSDVAENSTFSSKFHPKD